MYLYQVGTGISYTETSQRRYLSADCRIQTWLKVCEMPWGGDTDEILDQRKCISKPNEQKAMELHIY